MLIRRLATGATSEKQARYRRDTGEGLRGAARHLYAHNIRTLCTCVAIEGPWHLLFNVRRCIVHPVPAYEFRRGFCTLIFTFLVRLTKTHQQIDSHCHTKVTTRNSNIQTIWLNRNIRLEYSYLLIPAATLASPSYTVQQSLYFHSCFICAVFVVCFLCKSLERELVHTFSSVFLV